MWFPSRSPLGDQSTDCRQMATIQAKLAARGLEAGTEPYSAQQLSDFSPVLGGPFSNSFDARTYPVMPWNSYTAA